MTVQELGWRLTRIIVIMIEAIMGITGIIQPML
jgi:hypothetical protein